MKTETGTPEAGAATDGAGKTSMMSNPENKAAATAAGDLYIMTNLPGGSS
jgi:hypothetical protein